MGKSLLTDGERRELIKRQAAEIEQLRAVVSWVESWVSNPVGSYSVSALDGLFGMTRDKIAALSGKRSGTEQ